MGLDSSPANVCKGGATSRVTRDELLSGLRARGYDLFVDPSCTNPSASSRVSNTTVYAPDVEDFDVVVKREGAVSCYVFPTAEGQGPRVKVRQFEGEDLVSLSTLNVSCTLKPDPEQQSEQIARLEAALTELAADAPS